MPSGEEVERVIDAGGTAEHERALGLYYPAGLYSLSHVALPFPMTDSLYGLTPDPNEDFGLNLGALAPRGERNVLIASLDSLLRASSNPFFPYMIERIDEGVDGKKRVKLKMQRRHCLRPSTKRKRSRRQAGMSASFCR